MKKYNFKELTSLVQYGLPLPAIKRNNLSDILYIRITDINNNGKINLENVPTCDKSKILKEKILKNGDVLIARTGTVGKSFFYESKYGISTFAGYFIRFVTNKKIILSKYFYYLTCSDNFKKWVNSISKKSVQPGISATLFLKYETNVPTISYQQQIINTIEPFEKLLEIINSEIKIINNIFYNIAKKNKANLLKMKDYFSFIKGIEINSKMRNIGYQKNQHHYIRVGDLLNKNNLYTDFYNENYYCKYDDILLATDGAPGRFNIGLQGIYSTAIRKIVANTDKHLSEVYCSLHSELNKAIFKGYSNGTTILHGTRSLNHLVLLNFNEKTKYFLKKIYEKLIINEIIKTKLEKVINLLIKQLIQ